ncbi:DUF4375 domain-containing protein [Emticicia sp. 21SJ11W-3]|uniref:DMP19 family protein n=1 Tax=Emticicia sp. 21SJ11W-3 TaxID=2916755 RepID=UPI0020A06C60|nr:DUF4375 domain-containing protein [Emticicia sp. 21SJ11W-3]UTA66596.1 DMP19 family protein [Emticicia sp. 21SJ11W-3]
MKTREELQSTWENLVDNGFKNYESLSREERIWFNLEPITVDGIFDQYTNYGAEHIEDIIEDLIYLGFNDIAGLVQRMNMLFPGGKPSRDINERNKVIQEWTTDQSKMMESINDEFWLNYSDLEDALLNFINKSGL